MKLKAFSLVESLISMNIIVFCIMLISLAFVKTDNYNSSKNRIISIITIDNIESDLYSTQGTIVGVIDRNLKFLNTNLNLDYDIEKMSNNLTKLKLSTYQENKLIYSRTIILRNSTYYEEKD